VTGVQTCALPISTFLHILYYIHSLEKPINTGFSAFFRGD
jgi:hypothetical protein